MVDDVKALMKILLLYVPLPLFWALQDQQGSRWTFQAARMTGEVGSFTIKPDQMQVVNPLLIIVFIPLWDVLVYPLLHRCGIRRPLQKMTLGMVMAGLAFFISAIVELQLEKSDPIVPGPYEGQLRLFNGIDCPLVIRSNVSDDAQFTLNSMSMFERKHIGVTEKSNYSFASESSASSSCASSIRLSGNFLITPNEATSYFLTRSYERNATPYFVMYKDSPEKPHQGLPTLRVLSTTSQLREVKFKAIDKDIFRLYATDSQELKPIPTGVYDVLVDNVPVHNIQIFPGAVYTYVLTEKTPNYYVRKAIFFVIN